MSTNMVGSILFERTNVKFNVRRPAIPCSHKPYNPSVIMSRLIFPEDDVLCILTSNICFHFCFLSLTKILHLSPM